MPQQRPDYLAQWEWELLTATEEIIGGSKHASYTVYNEQFDTWVAYVDALQETPSKDYNSLEAYSERLEAQLEKATKELAYEKQCYKYLHALYVKAVEENK